MLKFYGNQPPAPFNTLRLGGQCPHCNTGTTFGLTSEPSVGKLRANDIKQFVANYSCDICLGPIPVRWSIIQWGEKNQPLVGDPTVVLPAREEYDFDHVPEEVKSEIEEALDCLSINAYNGFAAVCRRSVQAICTNLGADSSTRVKKQIEEMAKLIKLDKEGKELIIQVMLSGHDGSHPHLPEVDAERAAILLSMLRDLTHQLYTRPGRITAAAKLREEAIKKRAETDDNSAQ